MVTFKTKKLKKAQSLVRKKSRKRKITSKKRLFSKYLLKFMLFMLVFGTITVVVG
jgi:hypothetical protein